MSQAKVDRYKKEKADRKKIMAREKAQRITMKICAWAILAAIVCWAGYSAYGIWDANRPVKTYKCDITAMSSYLNGLNAEQ